MCYIFVIKFIYETISLNLGLRKINVNNFIKARNVYLYTGRSYINIKEWSNALSPLRAAYSLSPAETKKEISEILMDVLLSVTLNEIKKGNSEASMNYIFEYSELNSELRNSGNEMLSFLLSYADDEFKRGTLSNTINVLKIVLGMDSANSQAYFGLARALFGDGNKFEAMEYLTKAILLDPDNKEIRDLHRLFYK